MQRKDGAHISFEKVLIPPLLLIFSSMVSLATFADDNNILSVYKCRDSVNIRAAII